MKLRAFIVALHAALFSILAAASPAGPASMTLLGLGKPAAGGGSPIYTAGNCQNNHAAFTTSTQTFTGMQGGSYPSNGIAVIGLVQDQNYPNPQNTFWTFTVGGHALNYISAADDGSSRSTLWYVSVNSGDADTVVLTQPNSHTSAYTAVCAAFIANATATPTGSGSAGFASQIGGVTFSSTLINIPATGFGVILYGSSNPAATGTGETITFSGTTASGGDASSLVAANIQIAMSHQNGAVTSWSPTATGSPNSINFAYSISGAAWGP